MKVVVIAGGKGTRIASVNNEIPKAMIPVGGKPVLEHQVEMACAQGFCEFVFVIGYLGHIIEEYFGDGSRWGADITYYKETVPLGTAGALAELRDVLAEDFFVFYGDTVMDIDLCAMLQFHKQHGSDMTLYVHPNDHPFDSDIVMLNSESRVQRIEAKPHPEGFVSPNVVNAALFVFSPRVLDVIPKGEKSHIEKNIIPECLSRGLNVFGYLAHEYIKDMGTPGRYEKVCADWASGRVQALNRKNNVRAVFLDRDGVINKDNGLVCKPEQIELVEGVENALNYIHEKGFLIVVVTNQSVIARNLCTFEELNTINNTLETLLGKKHTYYDALYYCPHHPDGGYPEERKEYKIKCSCRKPAPGLLLRASKDWNIDLSESYMIGDRDSDVEAGRNAGVKNSVKVETNDGISLMETLIKILN